MKKQGWGQRLTEVQERLAPRGKLEFSYSVGSNRSSWPKFEREEVPPPLDVLIRLKERGVNLDWLATGEGRMLGDSPFSEGEWADLAIRIEEVLATRLPDNQKAAAIVNYLRSLLDAPAASDSIPSTGISTEAANDRETAARRRQKGAARDDSGK
jgi:hypothetical protein